MSKTACWGTNSSFDCAWISFGYGSYFDMCYDYKFGWWLSKEALATVVKYDRKLDMIFPSNDDLEFRQCAQRLGYEPDDKFYEQEVCDKIWNTLPTRLKMKYSHLHIMKHPEADTWFEEMITLERVPYNHKDNFMKHIKNNSIEDYKLIRRIEEMNLQAMESYTKHYRNDDEKDEYIW